MATRSSRALPDGDAGDAHVDHEPAERAERAAVASRGERERVPDAAYAHTHAAPVAGGDAAQVLGLVGGPFALLLGLAAKYALSQTVACDSPPGGPLAVHLVALATLLLALGATGLAHRQWRRAGQADPGDGGGREGRTRVMAAMGVGMGALSALVIVAQWLPQVVIRSCQP